MGSSETSPSVIGKFDLNMEEVLEAWGPPDAVREVIANALDEHSLTNSKPIKICKDDDNRWHIRDYGRGLKYTHLTQNEDQEKLNNPDKVIGKFGVGLKDAFATFYRHGISVTIHSAHNTFNLDKAPKHGFEDIETLHVIVKEPEKGISGTDVILDGINKDDIEGAKKNFLYFSDEELLEKTIYGEVYRSRKDPHSNIYVNGLLVATENNFFFTYNITNTTKKIRDALNRERSNVGRSAYSSRVKRILQNCKSEKVAEPLVDDLERYEFGDTHDELSWKDIRLHAVKLLNAKEKVVFVTSRQRAEQQYTLGQAKGDGYDVVTIPENIENELRDQKDIAGNKIRDIFQYKKEFNESFEYKWVDPDQLTKHEREVWDLHKPILDILPEKNNVKDVKISETMRLNVRTNREITGLWKTQDGVIIIKRDRLRNSNQFVSTLIHELAHVRSKNAQDLTDRFEQALAEISGEIILHTLKR